MLQYAKQQLLGWHFKTEPRYTPFWAYACFAFHRGPVTPFVTHAISFQAVHFSSLWKAADTFFRHAEKTTCYARFEADTKGMTASGSYP